MKFKSFFLVLLMAMVQVVNSQTIVGTEPENRNALIEEFTGIGCGFCPYGHLEVANFISANPGDGFSIAMHQGYFAIPDENQPDYSTDQGDEYGDYFSVNSWPNALINRHDHGSGLLYPQNEWQQYAYEVITEMAYVNIACEASLDVQTRELTILVEVYYTDDNPVTSNYLNVAIIQNDIKGPQFSSWFNPDAITPDGAYMHQHMLRDVITSQWGDEITTTTSGTFFEETYVYTVPEFINDVPLRIGDLGVVCYITETEEEVENVHGNYPELENFAYTYDVGIYDLILPSSSCAFLESKVIVENHGSETIQSIDFQIIVQEEEPVNYTWEGEGIEPFTAADIELPATLFSGTGTLGYTVEILTVNGQDDENPDNNEKIETFQQAEEVALPVTLHLTTDNYFGTAWYLYDDQNNVIQQGSGYGYNQTFTIPLEADAGCYKLEMTDLDGFFFGSYSLEDGNNNTFFSRNGNFGNSEITSFSLPIYAPSAIIGANSTVACIGGAIQFVDESTGGPETWSWTFEGGDPATSDEKNPVVSYSQPGSFDVTLEVSNPLGTDEIFFEDYITVTSLSYGNLALEFDGSNDYVEVTNESAFDFTDALTLEAWIKPESLSGTQGVLSKNFGNNAHPYQIRLSDDEIVLGFYSNTIGWQPVQTSSANLVVGQWTHIACTYNMAQAKIYVDGVQKATANKSFEIPQNDQPFEIGRTKDVGYEYFNGIIEEVRVWDIALGPDEIADNMCANYLGSTDPNLVAYYKFNECGGTLLTEKQNGYDGVLMSMDGDEWLESDACPVYTVDFIIYEDPGSVPVEGATVNLSGIIRYSDESGLADFEGYETGLYDYQVYKDGYEVAEGSFELIDEDLTIEIGLLISGIDSRLPDQINIFPNPSSGKIIVSTPGKGSLDVLDVKGRLLLQQEILSGSNSVDLGGNDPGLYFLRLKLKDQLYFDKVMIR